MKVIHNYKVAQYLAAGDTENSEKITRARNAYNYYIVKVWYYCKSYVQFCEANEHLGRNPTQVQHQHLQNHIQYKRTVESMT